MLSYVRSGRYAADMAAFSAKMAATDQWPCEYCGRTVYAEGLGYPYDSHSCDANVLRRVIDNLRSK